MSTTRIADYRVDFSGNRALQGLRDLIDNFRRSETAANRSRATVQNALQGIGNVRVRDTFLRSFNGQMGQVRAEAQRTVSSVRSSLGGVGTLVTGALAVGTGDGIKDVTADFIRFEQALTIVMGSTAAMRREMEFVTGVSERLGFRTRDLLKGYVGLTAASKGTVLQGKATRDIFLAITRAGAAYSLSSENMEGALLAVQQMMSKGKISAEELRGQLGERLYGAFQIAARAVGLTTSELDKLLETGNLASTDFLPRFAAQLNSEIPAGTKNATAEFERFKSSLDEARVIIGKSGFFAALADAAAQATGQLRSLAADGSLKRFGEVLGEVMRTIIKLVPLIPALVTGLIAYKGIVIGVTTAMAMAQATTRGWTAALLANPVTAVAVAVAALAGGIVYLAQTNNSAANATRQLVQEDERLTRIKARALTATEQLAYATGKAREEALANARALQVETQRYLQNAQAALQAARAKGIAARQEAQSQFRTASMSTRGAGGGIDPLTSRSVTQAAQASDAAVRQYAQARRNVRDAETELARIESEIARAGAPVDLPPLPAFEAKGDKKRGGKTDEQREAEQAAERYADAISNLNDRIRELTYSEEQLALADELERAGLSRDVTLVNDKANAVRDLFNRIREGEKAAKVTEVLAEFNRSMANLLLTEEQLAQVEARRRAGLSEDLSVTNAQTRAVDAQAAAYFRLDQARQNASTNRAFAQEQGQRQRDAEFDGRAIGAVDQDQVELDRRRQWIEDERLANIQRITDLQGITEARREELIAIENAIAAQRQLNEETARQQANTQALSNFMMNLFESPRKAMRAFFQDLMKRLLEAIIRAAILGEKLGGAGGVGGLLKNVVGGALGLSGARRNGGSVRAGGTYLVGEGGPEIVRFGQAGQVMSNHRSRNMMGGGAMTLAPTYNIQLSGDRETDDMTLAQIKAQQAQQNAAIRQQQKARTWNG